MVHPCEKAGQQSIFARLCHGAVLTALRGAHRFALENICGQPLCSGPQLSRLKPELYAASGLRRHRRRGRRGFSPAPLD